MPLRIPIEIAGDLIGVLRIERLTSLDTNDSCTYAGTFSAPEWREGKLVPIPKFTHAYSDGVLSLTATAIQKLLSKYPELRAGRFGVPRNRAKCRKCGDIIWSRSRHDFTSCSCGAISVDGGYDYARRVAQDLNDIIEVPEEWQTPKKPSSRSKSSRSKQPRK